MTEEECGDVSEYGRWYGLLTKTGIRGAANAIVTEDSQGFFDYEAFSSAATAKAKFRKIEKEVSSDMSGDE